VFKVYMYIIFRRITDHVIIISCSSSRCSRMRLYIIVLYLMTTLLLHSSTVFSVVTTFTPSPVTTLRRLAVDPQSGTVYVGAVNHVYQLNADLSRVVVDVTTGPVQDNKDCADFDRNGNLDCDLPTSLTDNYNQVTIFCCVNYKVDCFEVDYTHTDTDRQTDTGP